MPFQGPNLRPVATIGSGFEPWIAPQGKERCRRARSVVGFAPAQNFTTAMFVGSSLSLTLHTHSNGRYADSRDQAMQS